MQELAPVQALYLHIPFCVRKCAYCDFASRATRRDDPAMEAYVRRLLSQLRAVADLGMLEGVKTAYIGGGTPTMLGPELLGSIVCAIRASCPGLVELTCEANPDSLSDRVLDVLATAGATRLSIGVQSLDDEELVALGRIHDARTAQERVAAAVQTGLDVSVDLMCATPRQTEQSWRQTLDGVLGLGVGHVSVYPLQIEEGTPLERALAGNDPAWNDPDVQAERMEIAARMLAAAGYARYEVASYALPVKACLHNQAYWTGRPYLGLGSSAASMLTREAYERLREAWTALPQVPKDVARVRLAMAAPDDGWLAAENNPHSLSTPKRASLGTTPNPFAGIHADIELLDAGQAIAEDLMLGMRMSAGVSSELLTRARATLGQRRVDKAVRECLAHGLAHMDHGCLKPTNDGWLLGNELYGLLWDLAPGSVRVISC